MPLVFPDVSRDWMLDTISNLLVSGTFQACLFQNECPLNLVKAQLSCYEECNFDGYSRQPLTTFVDDGSGHWDEEQVDFNTVTFTYAYSGHGVGNTAYGYYLVYTPPSSSDSVLICAEEFYRPVELILDGNGVSFKPKFRLAALLWRE